jgi:hypothetical protein
METTFVYRTIIPFDFLSNVAGLRASVEFNYSS